MQYLHNPNDFYTYFAKTDSLPQTTTQSACLFWHLTAGQCPKVPTMPGTYRPSGSDHDTCLGAASHGSSQAITHIPGACTMFSSLSSSFSTEGGIHVRRNGVGLSVLVLGLQISPEGDEFLSSRSFHFFQGSLFAIFAPSSPKNSGG